MTPDEREALDQRLPYGWLNKAQRLLRSKGRKYDDSTLSRVKNGAHQNAVIMGVLLQLCREEDRRKAKLHKAIIGKR